MASEPRGITRTSLTPYAASMRDPDPDGADRYAREAWHRHSVVVFTAGQLARMPWQDREILTSVAERVHGKRDAAGSKGATGG